MATRCEIMIKEKGKINSVKTLYHHWDGYYSGVGIELATMLSKESFNSNANITDDIANRLEELDKSYEVENLNKFMHEDAEYLYIVEIVNNKATLYGFEVLEFATPCKTINELLLNDETNYREVNTPFLKCGLYIENVTYLRNN